MRRAVSLAVATVALALALAMPATAAPTKAFHWTVACQNEAPFTVVAKGVPGWPAFEGGTPILLLGGTFTFTPAGGAPETWESPPPRVWRRSSGSVLSAGRWSRTPDSPSW